MMENERYESPRFEFHELKLVERIAEECWGTGNAWYDVDGDGVIDSTDIHLDLNGGCKGKESANALNEWAQKIGLNIHFTPNSANTKDEGIIVPIS